jgi:GR25 family glycosyltransferase involved in LPS biosynthesis
MNNTFKPNTTQPYTLVSAFYRKKIKKTFAEYDSSGLFHKVGFIRPKPRFARLGMSGRAYQGGFTVACSFTHRRVWQLFLQSNYSYAYIQEEDSVCQPFDVKKLIDRINSIDNNWHFIQIGRCWDFCESEKHVAKFAEYSVISSDSPSCSHAYIINRRAASILLTYSLPHITSVDLLFGLLSRMQILKLYSLTPILCKQNRTEYAHDDTNLTECDPNEKMLKANLAHKDEDVVNILQKQSWVRHYYQRGGKSVHRKQCDMTKYCKKTTSQKLEYNKEAYDILNHLELLKINDIIIYGRYEHGSYFRFQESLLKTFFHV